MEELNPAVGLGFAVTLVDGHADGEDLAELCEEFSDFLLLNTKRQISDINGASPPRPELVVLELSLAGAASNFELFAETLHSSLSNFIAKVNDVGDAHVISAISVGEHTEVLDVTVNLDLSHNFLFSHVSG